MDAVCIWQHSLSRLRLIGLDSVAAIILSSMNMEEVGAEKFRKMVEEVSNLAGVHGGAEEQQVYYKILLT